MQKKITHPLEGRYIVFTYRECDREDEGSALSVYRLEKGRLRTIFKPSLDFEPGQLSRECIYDKTKKEYVTPTQFAIRLLKEKGLAEVVTVMSTKNFFGIPPDCEFLDDEVDDEGNLTNWLEYDPVFETSDEYAELASQGIRVRLFDEDERQFIT